MASYKISLLGDGGVGKTAWIHKLKTGEFTCRYFATIGSKEHTINVETNYGRIKLIFFDNAGQEKYYSRSLPAKMDATILMFDPTNAVTYRELELWYEKCKSEPVIVVSNKSDIDDVHVKSPTFHLTHSLPYFKISVKTAPSYSEVLTHILRSITDHNDLVIHTL